MELVFSPRVKETSTTTGTGSYSLAGTVTGFQTFVAGVGGGKWCRYSATDGTDFEEGLGQVADGAPDTLSRAFITGSSNGGAAVNWGAGTKTIVCSETAGLIEQIVANFSAGDPNGFTNAAEWTFSYDAGTRTLTLTPVGASASFWSNGIKFVKTTAQTSTHPDTEGTHYWYFDDAGVLQTTMTFSTDLITKYCITAIVYWDATNNLAIPDVQWEMHGCVLASAEHLKQHVTVGSIYNKLEGGLTPTVTLGDGSAAAHIQVSSTAGSFFDEDIKHTVPVENSGDNKRKLYRSGANGDWRMENTHSAIIRNGGSGRALYNEWTGATWQDAECTDGYFIHVYRYVVNAPTPFAIYVQDQGQHATLADAQAAAQTRPDLGGLPGYEFLLVQTFIVQTSSAYTNAYKSRIVAAHDGSGWYDWREKTPQAGPGSASVGTYVDFPASSPSAPAADNVRIFGRKISGRMLAAIMGPSGLDTSLQPFFGRNKVAMATANGNATTVPGVFGCAISGTGTATAKNIATTNLNTAMRGLDYLVTTAATTAVAGIRGAASQFWRGNAAGLGGFFMVMRWAPATGVATATHRAFAGLRSSTAAPTDVEPSSLTNILGMGWDAADTNIQFMCNDGTGTATKADLGASFPVPTSNYPGPYEIAMFCPPNGSTIYYEVTNLATGAVATGSVTTDIPGNTTFLNFLAYCSVGGTSSVVGLTFFSLYIETDY